MTSKLIFLYRDFRALDVNAFVKHFQYRLTEVFLKKMTKVRSWKMELANVYIHVTVISLSKFDNILYNA